MVWEEALVAALVAQELFVRPGVVTVPGEEVGLVSSDVRSLTAEDQIAYSSVHPVCLDHMCDYKVVESALCTSGN